MARTAPRAVPAAAQARDRAATRDVSERLNWRRAAESNGACDSTEEPIGDADSGGSLRGSPHRLSRNEDVPEARLIGPAADRLAEPASATPL